MRVRINNSLFWTLYRQGLEKMFSYRVNFWVSFWGSALTELIVAYLLWFSIFESQNVQTIGGFTFEKMMFYYLVVSFVGRLIRGSENYDVSVDIYEGGLTKYLLYPYSYFKFKYAEHLAYTSIGFVQALLAAILVYFLFPQSFEHVQLNIVSLPVYFLAVLMASFFYFIMMTLIEMVAFWADNVWSLSVMARFVVGFFGGFYLPLNLFPQAMQSALDYSPFPALTYIPVLYLFGEKSLMDLLWSLLILAVWTLIFIFIVRMVWIRGQRRYSGVGQ